MRSFVLPFVILVGLSGIVTACETCGPSSEPSLQINVAWATASKLDTLYALRSQRPLPPQPYATTELTTYNQFTVPLNLNADSTQYVFQQNGRKDTLTIFYKRDYSYRNTKCGYVLDLNAPAGQSARVTHGTVESVGYEQNTYQRGFLSPSRETGIYLSLRL